MRPPGAGTAFAVAAAGIAVFSAMDAVMKGLTLALGAYDTMLWRCIAGTILSGALYAVRRSSWPARATMRLHALRGAIGAAMAVLFFWGLARVPLAQGTALAFIAPLIALFLAAALLKERIGRGTILASTVAFAGVAVILAGQARAAMGPEALRGALAILVSALLYAFNIVLMRRQALIAGPVEIAFFQNLFVTLVLAPAAPLIAAAVPIAHAPLIVVAAALATVSLLLLSWAYARAGAGYLAATEYTALLWAALLGFLVFGERVSPWTVAGAVLIVAGCVLATRRDASPVADLEAAI